MTNRKTWFKKFISCLLALSFVMAIGNVNAAEVQASPEKIAWEKAVSLQSTIIRDVPDCPWTAQTVCSDAFPLYDLDDAVNGYVFEFKNSNTEVGFIQIDLSTDVARLDSYCFSGVHTSKIMCDLLELPTSDAPIAYLGGYAYYQKQNGITRDGVKTYRDLVSGEELKSNSEAFASLKNEYVSFVAEKSVATTNNTRSMYTVTKFVDGYRSLGWETYDSIGDGNNKCAPIAITNICKYWRFCKGKSLLFISTASTYATIKSFFSTFTSQGVPMNEVKQAWIDYVENQGYEARVYDISSSVTFDTCRSFIDNNRPFIYNANYMNWGDLYRQSHAVAVFGYQYIDVEDTLLIADAVQSTIVYKTFSSMRKTDGKHSCVIPY